MGKGDDFWFRHDRVRPKTIFFYIAHVCWVGIPIRLNYVVGNPEAYYGMAAVTDGAIFFVKYYCSFTDIIWFYCNNLLL